MDAHALSDEQLRIAFVLWAARRVANADEELTVAEIALVARRIPDETLVRLGFLDADRVALTPLYHVAKVRAAEQLPHRLGADEKADIVRFLSDVALDGGLDPAESRVVDEVRLLLG